MKASIAIFLVGVVMWSGGCGSVVKIDGDVYRTIKFSSKTRKHPKILPDLVFDRVDENDVVIMSYTTSDVFRLYGTPGRALAFLDGTEVSKYYVIKSSRNEQSAIIAYLVRASGQEQ